MSTTAPAPPRARPLDKLLTRLGLRPSPNPDPSLTTEQRALGAKLARNKRLINAFWAKLNLVRAGLVLIGVIWILLLPYPALWKHVFVDEHALQPAQVVTYWGWDDVHVADHYLAELERLRDEEAPWEVISTHLVSVLSSAGHSAGLTSTAAYAHITPPRSEGTEAILLSANWLSRDGAINVRGVALLLSLAAFFRAQNHWAFDVYCVFGEGYAAGLEGWMEEYTPRANVWTALNIDYPYHSFSHLGFFYEGVNGRLPNQDVLNTAGQVAQWTGGVDVSLYDTPARQPASYMAGAKNLLRHFSYAALGRPSAAGGVLAKHRIDALTFYAVPAEGPHGFHSLGRTVESTLRSFNNLLERLHASFFFYLLPHAEWFLPVGHYLPAAVILGVSVTVAGFDCPDPLAGALWTLPAVLVGLVGWYAQSPTAALCALQGMSFLRIQPTGKARQSLAALAHLFYGALIPTLAMVNFPQAILLAVLVLLALSPVLSIPLRRQKAELALGKLAVAGVLLFGPLEQLRDEYVLYGNVAWPGVFAVLVPLLAVAWMTPIEFDEVPPRGAAGTVGAEKTTAVEAAAAEKASATYTASEAVTTSE